jgi:RNA polymerase sigma factor (sigma-70 family)
MNKYYRAFVGDEDLVQCGMLGLVQAANSWDENKGEFSTYSVKCIRNAIAIEFRKRDKHKGVLSLDTTTIAGTDGENFIMDWVVGDEDVDYVDVDSLIKLLNSKDAEILKLKLSGMTQVDIAKKYGVSREEISRRVRRIRRVCIKNGYFERKK